MKILPLAVFMLYILNIREVIGDKHACSECDRSVDIAIVGAGIAGTNFAYKLRKDGLHIELFEYSDRVGGRLFTTTLPNVHDVNLELGGMRFHEDKHKRFRNLVQELNLNPVEFTGGYFGTSKTKYFLRGRVITHKEFQNGDVPYNLSPEERKNADNILQYYFEKLTGVNTSASDQDTIKLTTQDGIELAKLSMNEVLDKVATPEGKQLANDIYYFDGSNKRTDSALQYFITYLDLPRQRGRTMSLKEGMSSVPISLVEAFLQYSHRHKLTVNRKLEAIRNEQNGGYKLHLIKTTTLDGLTVETGSSEFVCAKKVVLAIPLYALTRLKWEPLSSTKVKTALHAWHLEKVSKIFMTFPYAWWLNVTSTPSYMLSSDTPFQLMCDWKSSNVSGDSVMIASYAEGENTRYLQNLNFEVKQYPRLATGYSTVSYRLKEELLHQLAEAHEIDRSQIPEPINTVSFFWTTYPYGCGWTVWKAGINAYDVMQTIERPSLEDDVFIVGSDSAFLGLTFWSEGALARVEDVYHKYFTKTCGL